MSLDSQITDVIIKNAFHECFTQWYFDIVPLNKIPGIHHHPLYETLRRAHCMKFDVMPDETISSLKSAVKHVIDDCAEALEPEQRLEGERSFWRSLFKRGSQS